jgi:hypothetical protein
LRNDTPAVLEIEEPENSTRNELETAVSIITPHQLLVFRHTPLLILFEKVITDVAASGCKMYKPPVA